MKISHKHIIIAQISFLIIVGIVLYYLYPHVDQTINGNVIRFNSENSHTIIFSKNTDFSNPQYVYMDRPEAYVQLEPGIYYWKPANSVITGFENKIEIASETSLVITSQDDEIVLQNVGNVKLNVTKNSDGIMVGHIILEPTDEEKINDEGMYEGRQAG